MTKRLIEFHLRGFPAEQQSGKELLMRKGREELPQEGPKTSEEDWANLLKTAADEIGECSYEPPEEVCEAARQAFDSGVEINDVLSFYNLTAEDVLTRDELCIYREMHSECLSDYYPEASDDYLVEYY